MENKTKKIPIGLQLFSVRGECSKDLPATIKAVSDIGYVGVEPWGYGGDKLEWMGWSVKFVKCLMIMVLNAVEYILALAPFWVTIYQGLLNLIKS